MNSPRLRELRMAGAEHKQPTGVHREPEPITDDDHRDPVPGFEGRWLAGFSTVDGTEFIVIVQTRYDTAVEPNAQLWRRLVAHVGTVVIAWSAVFSISLVAYARHRQRHRSSRRDSMLAVSPRP